MKTYLLAVLIILNFSYTMAQTISEKSTTYSETQSSTTIVDNDKMETKNISKSQTKFESSISDENYSSVYKLLKTKLGNPTTKAGKSSNWQYSNDNENFYSIKLTGDKVSINYEELKENKKGKNKIEQIIGDIEKIVSKK
jgi:hypothetical protein